MKELSTLCESIQPESFCNAFRILLNKPHVINKRVWGSQIIHNFFLESVNPLWTPPYDCFKLSKSFDVQDQNLIVAFIIEQFSIQNVKNTGDISKILNVIECYVIELFPKLYPGVHAYQLILFQSGSLIAWFCDITCKDLKQNLCPDFPYSLQLQDKNLILKSQCDGDSKAFKWLQETVLPQFIKWGEHSLNNFENKHIISCESLSLISTYKYYQKYNELKIKYGKEMVKVWPECTDPSKFVYEDVAIASYLILIWEDERLKNTSTALQSFVDLGCGNGLLVYILSQEGHPGIGIDVRKRQIWDTYPADVCLEENTIVPSDVHLFPNTDYIIGNHSDELTPWIPVVAARSSYKCKYFLLPCCAFNFNGTKYQRRNSSKSQYMDYLEHIKNVSEKCGFVTEIDRLKIPSTKRICLIGRQRRYEKENIDLYNSKIQLMIEDDSPSYSDKTDLWISDFKSRDTVERVKNCTQIGKDVINSIVEIITNKLLEDCNFDEKWSPGKIMDIKELVQLLPSNMLIKLKSECGGLQTLLRNNHQIFKVKEGTVQLKYPGTVDELDAKVKTKQNRNFMFVKKKPCWFYKNHPQGCPLSEEKCSFLHLNQ